MSHGNKYEGVEPDGFGVAATAKVGIIGIILMIIAGFLMVQGIEMEYVNQTTAAQNAQEYEVDNMGLTDQEAQQVEAAMDAMVEE